MVGLPTPPVPSSTDPEGWDRLISTSRWAQTNRRHLPFLWSQSNDSRVLSEECPGTCLSVGLREAPGDAPTIAGAGGGPRPLWVSGSHDALWWMVIRGPEEEASSLTGAGRIQGTVWVRSPDREGAWTWDQPLLGSKGGVQGLYSIGKLKA